MPANKKPRRSESPTPVQSLGREGERLAAEYLEKKGYKVVASRFRLFHGEIDLIAWDGDTLVFVEVKARTSDDFGLPEESVTPAKQRQRRTRMAADRISSISRTPSESVFP